MSETAAPQFVEPEAPVEPSADASPKAEDPKPEEGKGARTPDEYEHEIAKLRRESAGYRTKLRETEPIVKAAQEAEEANKTEIQRAQERAAQLEKDYAELQQANYRLDLAAQYSIPRDDIDLIGSGSREDMEKNAARLGALFTTTEKKAPPSDRPVEGLRPGASPEPPKPEDHSYPANWGFQPPRES